MEIVQNVELGKSSTRIQRYTALQDHIGTVSNFDLKLILQREGRADSKLRGVDFGPNCFPIHSRRVLLIIRSGLFWPGVLPRPADAVEVAELYAWFLSTKGKSKDVQRFVGILGIDSIAAEKIAGFRSNYSRIPQAE